MFTLSEGANPNYVCKIVKLKGLHKHPNADRLQMVSIDFNNVITGLSAKDGEIYCYFPVESKINSDFLSKTNSFRDKTLNDDPEQAGFFEQNCRVKAMRLRGEKSMGYIVPIQEIFQFVGGQPDNIEELVNTEFDMVGTVKLVEKYMAPTKQSMNAKQGKEPAVTRLVDGQVHLHVDTENLRKNAYKLNPDTLISITYKTHGTSGWAGNLLVKKPMKWYEKLLKKMGVDVVDQVYDIVYGSRRVVKNKYLEDPKLSDHFYDYDLWGDVVKRSELDVLIPKGYTLYYEILGYTKDGGEIQQHYHYGCAPGEYRLEVYRITHTNVDGHVTELSTPQIREFCVTHGLNPSHMYYHGKAGDLYDIPHGEHWNEQFVRALEDHYNERDCWMCTDKVVPEEGICVRLERGDTYDIYKLKSFRFLEFESAELDKGVVSMEEEN